MKKTKYFIIIILILGILFNICFWNKYPIFAIENQYNNQLLKLNLEKVDDNTINIKVYSSKPYPIELIPIKKDAGEYIIFLPETYHSITSKPNISPYANQINDIDIKLIPYTSSNSNNGYTQISIKTNGSNVKINVDNEISHQDFKFQEELSRILISKPSNSVQLRPKKTTQNIQKISNIIPKQKKTTNLTNTVSKSTTPTKKIVINSKKETPKTHAKKTPEKKALNTQTKPVKQENLKTTNITVKKEATEKNPEPKEIKENTPESETQKPDNTATSEPTQNTENADISENTENEIQEITEELTDNSDNSTINPANSTNLATTELQSSTNKTKKSNPFLKLLFPAIISLILALIAFKIIKKIASKKNDSPIKIINQPEPQFTQGYNKEVRQNGLKSQPEKITEALSKESIKDVITKSQSKPLNSKPEDIITRLAQNPLKPPQTNPLKTKEYTEISPNQLNIDHNKPKINEANSGELKFIAGIEVANERSFHLIQLEAKKALIGIIGSEIFILNEFNRIKSPKFIVRKTAQENSSDKDVYFVQVGTWCALVSSEKDSMKLETVF